ncbi:S9 family peptidase [Arthrobacter halodurans]|uniref:Prolyl oligopeptidase family serine peptidase n=1 Tax=Arthrobacter halodurans TaxID=516699 RepID=A0ABV4UKY2_9MICC
MTTVSAPSISPDGRHAVVAASRPSFDADKSVGQLWMVDLQGAEPPRRFTRGQCDSSPRYSPDGRVIAFLRPDDKGRPQLALVDARGGEPRIVTDRHLGVAGFAFSPDGARIAFASRTPEDGRYGTLDGVGAGAEDPRRITGFKYRGNGLGFTRDKVQGIYLIDVPSVGDEPFVEPVGRAAKALKGMAAESDDGAAASAKDLPHARLLTPEDRDASEPEFSRDGRHLYFTASLHDGADRDLRSMVHRVRVDDAAAAPEPVAGSATAAHGFGTPVFSRDGATLFLLGQELGPDGTDFVARNAGVYALDLADGLPAGEPRLLTDLDASDYGDVHSTLVPHGESRVMAFARVRGSGELHLLDAAGGVETLVSGPLEVTGAAEAGGAVVVAFADPSTTGEVGLVEDGTVLRLTDFSRALRSTTRIAEPRELVVDSADGYPVHGWVFLPEGEGPHPVLLNIHGGPFSQYGWSYFDEAQVYAEAGYAVVQCNPRGSASYGREHGLAIKGAMGTVDLQDVLAFLDGAVAAEPALDGGRVGVLGGSYGGYLTAWTIANDHRFQAAIVERGYLDPLSFIGSSDIGWFFSEAYTGADPEHTLTQSPMARVADVRTPTLVLHSEEDYRCPLEQAQRYYVELLRHGVDAEFLLFPGENHELSRAGTPWHRRQRFEAILEWFGRYLPVGGAAPEAAEATGAPVPANAR